jgi:hypothetical protein
MKHQGTTEQLKRFSRIIGKLSVEPPHVFGRPAVVIQEEIEVGKFITKAPAIVEPSIFTLGFG